MVLPIRLQLRSLCALLWHNLTHYIFAIWGLRLRLDPDYPLETHFRGDLITDAVLEYRGYGLFVPWCVFLAAIVDSRVLAVIGVLWAVLAYRRAYFYSSRFRFWRRAFSESPAKERPRTRYAEELMAEIARRLKAGADYQSPAIQDLVTETLELQNLICKKGN